MGGIEVWGLDGRGEGGIGFFHLGFVVVLRKGGDETFDTLSTIQRKPWIEDE